MPIYTFAMHRWGDIFKTMNSGVPSFSQLFWSNHQWQFLFESRHILFLTIILHRLGCQSCAPRCRLKGKYAMSQLAPISLISSENSHKHWYISRTTIIVGLRHSYKTRTSIIFSQSYLVIQHVGGWTLVNGSTQTGTSFLACRSRTKSILEAQFVHTIAQFWTAWWHLPSKADVENSWGYHFPMTARVLVRLEDETCHTIN